MARITRAIYQDTIGFRNHVFTNTRMQSVIMLLMKKEVISSFQYRRYKRLELSTKIRKKIYRQKWKTKILGLIT